MPRWILPTLRPQATVLTSAAASAGGASAVVWWRPRGSCAELPVQLSEVRWVRTSTPSGLLWPEVY
eukprot:9041696-Ditylum_brightwellii.AAC.1